MEEHLQAALDAEDLPAVAKGLIRVASLTPDPSWNAGAQGWSALANNAADAAKQGDVAAVKAACKSCHKAWRAKYKQTFRLRPIAD
jgi:cytochrome c553